MTSFFVPVIKLYMLLKASGLIQLAFLSYYLTVVNTINGVRLLVRRLQASRLL